MLGPMIPLATACLAVMLLSAVKRRLVLDGDHLARACILRLCRESTPASYAQMVELSTNLLDVACTQARLASSAVGHEAEARVALDVVRCQVRVLGDDLRERWRAWSAAAALLPATLAVAPLRPSDVRLPALRALALLDNLARPVLTPRLGLWLHVGLLRLGLAFARRMLAGRVAPSRLVAAGMDLATLARVSIRAYEALVHAPTVYAGVRLDPIA